MGKKEQIATDLSMETEKRISDLVKIGRFKSRDDFIELACNEFILRHSPPVPIPDKLGVTLILEY